MGNWRKKRNRDYDSREEWQNNGRRKLTAYQRTTSQNFIRGRQDNRRPESQNRRNGETINRLAATSAASNLSFDPHMPEILSKIEDVVTPKIAVELKEGFFRERHSAFYGEICNIRTGGHIGFIRSTIYGAGPVIILGTSAIAQMLVQDKAEMTEKGKTRFGRALEERDTILYLPLMTHNVIRMVSMIKWREGHLRFVPFTRNQIRMSCIRISQNGAPTQNDLSAMEENRFNQACTVFLGRYLICYNDPVIIAYYILSQKVKAPMVSALTRDGIVRLRLQKMLVGTHCHKSKIDLDWEDISTHLPPSACNIDAGCELRSLLCYLQLPMEDVVPEVWNVPEILVKGSDDVDSITKCMLTEMSELSKVGNNDNLKGIKYSDHFPQVDYTTLLYRQGPAEFHDDLFASLNNSSLVNYEKCLQERYEARYGPADAERNELHLVICALSDVFYRPFVEPFAADYLVGTSNRAQMIRNCYYHWIKLIENLENYSLG